jgi:hypothetical protein
MQWALCLLLYPQWYLCLWVLIPKVEVERRGLSNLDLSHT